MATQINTSMIPNDDKEPHKLMKASSMQKPVLNLLKDYGMDSDGTWKQ